MMGPETDESLEETPVQEEQTGPETAPETAEEPAPQPTAEELLQTELESVKGELAGEKDKYLRLLAEYDNYRKRSARERDTSTPT